MLLLARGTLEQQVSFLVCEAHIYLESILLTPDGISLSGHLTEVLYGLDHIPLLDAFVPDKPIRGSKEP